MERKKLFEKLERAAKNYGFTRVWFNDYTFVAEEHISSVNVRIDEKYGIKLEFEISWASAGLPRPDEKTVIKHIEMCNRAITLKSLFESLIRED